MTVTVHDVPQSFRYEITVDGQPAGFAAYADAGRLRVFTHTEIAPRFAGQGLGGELIGAALADVRRRQLRVLPVCSFVRSYLQRHPESTDLVQQVTSSVPEQP